MCHHFEYRGHVISRGKFDVLRDVIEVSPSVCMISMNSGYFVVVGKGNLPAFLFLTVPSRTS